MYEGYKNVTGYLDFAIDIEFRTDGTFKSIGAWE
jgi:hypothetical protein